MFVVFRVRGGEYKQTESLGILIFSSVRNDAKTVPRHFPRKCYFYYCNPVSEAKSRVNRRTFEPLKRRAYDCYNFYAEPSRKGSLH